MATFVYSRLFSISSLPVSVSLAASAASAMFVNPSAQTTYISELEFHNTNDNSASVTLYFCPTVGGNATTPALSSQVAKFILATADTLWIEPKYPYLLQNQNEAFYAVASVSGVNIQLRGSIKV